MFEFARGVQKSICQNFYNYILAQSRRLGAPCNLILKLISCFFHQKCVFIWFLFSRYRVQFFQKIDFFLVSAYVIMFWPQFFQFIELKSKGGAVVTPPPSGVELWRFPLKPQAPGFRTGQVCKVKIFLLGAADFFFFWRRKRTPACGWKF